MMNSPADRSGPPDPKVPLSANSPSAEGKPPPILPSVPPIITGSTSIPAGQTSTLRRRLAVLLSLCLLLFLLGGVASVLDDSLVLLSGLHALSALSGILTFLSFLLLLLAYGLMGITPIIPKRVILPLFLFTMLGLLALFPILIYHRNWMMAVDWMLSLGQALLGLAVLWRLRGGLKWGWPIVEVRHLGSRAFSWWNLLGFLLLNGLVLLPAIAGYLAVCASLAVGHFTEGFLALRPAGLVMQARKYVRADGKTVLLFPMSHIADSDFYRAVSLAVSSNSIVLLDGVSDSKKLLTNGLSYKRAAKSLGLAEQHDDLNIRQGTLIRADVDVQDFAPSTIGILNLVGLVHSKGLNSSTVLLLMQLSPPPDIEKQLFDDVLLKRNEHLLKEFRARLRESDNFVIPWGAIHMPGIAREIQKSGFHLVETHDYVSIRFGSMGNKGSATGAVPKTK
ncbi:MAG: hypothetical protein ACREP9_11495 [Candidatus Dormibacteraceae bacterium]